MVSMRERQVAMDARKAQRSNAASAKKTAGSMGGLSELKQEFKRISWTTKDELRSYTKIVVGATFAVGLGIYVVDLIVRGTLSGLSGLVQAVAS